MLPHRYRAIFFLALLLPVVASGCSIGLSSDVTSTPEDEAKENEDRGSGDSYRLSVQKLQPRNGGAVKEETELLPAERAAADLRPCRTLTTGLQCPSLDAVYYNANFQLETYYSTQCTQSIARCHLQNQALAPPRCFQTAHRLSQAAPQVMLHL